MRKLLTIYSSQLLAQISSHTYIISASIRYTFLNERQREFIEFVLRNYIQEGVDELSMANLGSSLTSKYGSVYEGQKALGDVDEIKRVFVDFQQYLYIEKVA